MRRLFGFQIRPQPCKKPKCLLWPPVAALHCPRLGVIHVWQMSVVGYEAIIALCQCKLEKHTLVLRAVTNIGCVVTFKIHTLGRRRYALVAHVMLMRPTLLPWARACNLIRLSSDPIAASEAQLPPRLERRRGSAAMRSPIASVRRLALRPHHIYT